MEIFGNKMKTEGGAVITFNDMSLMPSFVELERKFEDVCSAFHDKLMKMGVKSYRVNDGWVNREKNIIHFLYKIGGYSYDEIAEALELDTADVVDMLDLDCNPK